MSTHREETIFQAAREIRDPAAQAAFLDQACAGDAALRADVEAMLSAEAALPTVTDSGAEPVRPAPIEKAGDTIDRYKLLQQIGEGGCGVVYMAEQSEPVHRKVALKVIKLGMDTKSVIARFDAERQALAMMDHPNIARVLDAGATSTGRPYFVMELVRGIPITKYCDANNLPAAQRLELFITVCHAIQHAHQKGIIHRDIKPSNILVTLHDGVPVPKVIDFGIAKATEARLTDLTLFTELHAFIGTPAYTSPEQAEMSGLDIDTRADIYSLGVLLYELLSGRLPFDPEKLLKAGLDEMRRTIREVEPPRPSTRLSTLTDAERTAIAKQRGLEPGQLSSLLRGDLDWIVMKTLEKDRTRRYDTANGLALDLQRYLGNEAVLARPPSTAYLLRKLIRRHRGAFAAGSAVLLALIVGIGVSTWQAIRATHAERAVGAERDHARSAEQKAKDQQQIADKARGEAEHDLYAASMNLAQAAWKDNNLSRLRAILEETRTYPDRGFEWYYWLRQAHLELRTLRGSSGKVFSVAFSPTGRRIVTGGGDGNAEVWDVETGRELLTLIGHKSDVYSVAFSPDGRRILTGGSDHTAKVWDAESGRKLLTLKGHKDAVYSVAFSPDGRWIVTGSGDKTAKVWDGETGHAVLSLIGHTQGIRSVAFSPDGRRIVTGANQSSLSSHRVDNIAKVWDAESGRELFSLSWPAGFGNEVTAVAFSPNSQRVITSRWDDTAKVWDAETGHELTLNVPKLVNAVAFSPDGHRIVTGSEDDIARVLDAETGHELITLKGHTGAIRSVAFSPDGRRVATASEDGTAKIWDGEKDQELVFIKAPETAGSVESVAFSSDGRRIATGGRDNTARVCDAESGRELLVLRGHEAEVNSVAFSPDNRWIVTRSDDDTAKVWDSETGRELFTIEIIGGPIGGMVSFSPDGWRIVTGNGAGSDKDEAIAKVWDAKTGRQLLSIKGYAKPDTSSEWCDAFSPDQRRIVTGSGKATDDIFIAKVRDVGTGRELFTVNDYGGHSAFSSDGQRLISAGKQNTAKVWDVESGRELLTLKGHTSDVTSVAFSSDRQRILTSSFDSTAKVWDAETGREMLTLSLDWSSIDSAAFSPDARRIVVGNSDGTAAILIAASDEEVEVWRKEQLAGQKKKEEVDERDRQDRAEYDAAMLKLSDAIKQKHWDEATAALAVAEQQTPEEDTTFWDDWWFKILIGKRDYLAAYKVAERFSDAYPGCSFQLDEMAREIANDESLEQRDLALAEKLATLANEGVDPKFASHLNTLARVLFMEGKNEAAIQTQEQAVAVAIRKRKPEFQKTLDSYRQGILPKAE